MIRRFKHSISAKIFLSIFAVLILTCAILFGVLSIYLPKTYEKQISTQFTKSFYSLIDELTDIGIEELPEKAQLFAMEQGTSIRIDDEAGQTIFKMNMDVHDEKEKNQDVLEASFINHNKSYKIITSAPSRNVSGLKQTIISILPVMSLNIISISLLAALLYSKILSKPIKKISTSAKKLAGLDFTWKCNVKSQDEIGVLAESLNVMAENLNQAMQDLKIEIDKQKMQDKQRSDLFIALSHELKTPITVLKGEIGGMIDGVGSYKDRDKYLQHIFQVTKELEDTVQEVMTISRMELNNIVLHPIEINLSEALESCMARYDSIIKKRKIHLQKRIAEDIHIVADDIYIRTVLSNVIGNAILHSPVGATVYLNTTPMEEETVLSIANTGVTISEEEIKRVFEPFYRADKSRQRYTGGTGLGLYAVKTILESHEYPYTIYNTNNRVVFEIYFPNE